MHHAKYKRRAPKVYAAAEFSIGYAQLQVSQAKGWRKKNVYTNQQSHQLVGRGRMGTYPGIQTVKSLCRKDEIRQIR